MQITIPHLEETPNSKQLVVHGESFLMLAGELQNSSMTSAKFMDEQWPKLAAANLNTVLGCVTWEQIEPQEGAFHFDELDKVVAGARRHGLRLVLLWFGSFKNGVSVHLDLPCRSETDLWARDFDVHSLVGQEGFETVPASET